jgi:hypothetical protein
MLWPSWPHPLRDLPSPQEAKPPAVPRVPAVDPPLRQGSGAGDREPYYAYHLGRAVQQYHERLVATHQLGEYQA